MLQPEVTLSIKDDFINCLKDSLFALNSNREFIIWNNATENLTGINRISVLGRSVDEVFEVSDASTIETIFDQSTHNTVVDINNKKFRLTVEKVNSEGDTYFFKGTLYHLLSTDINFLPPKYLVEVINASPISSIVFNLNGTILYSNNAYKEMWKLNELDLEFVNLKYNLFQDSQLERQGLMPFLKRAFSGEVMHSPVFDYTFNSSSLGRDDDTPINKLLAHMYPIHDEHGEVLYIILNFLDVTEQNKLQEAYKESKDRLQLALKGASLGAWDWNLETDEMVYNERWAAMIGYTLDEVYEITWEQLLHPDEKEGCIDQMKKFANGNEPEYEAEFRLMTKSGDYKWILDRGKIVAWNADGKPIRGAGTHMDITERKVDQRKLEESEIKYRRLVDNAPIGIAILMDHKIQYINKELARLGGAEHPEQVYGMDVKDFLVVEDDYEVFNKRVSMVIDQGINAPLYSTQFRNLKGQVVDIEIVSIPVEYDGQKGIQVLIHDISDRKLALKELSRSQKLLNQLFDNSPMGIVFLDKNFNVRNSNKGFERIFGFSEAEVKGKSLMDFTVPDELKAEAVTLNQSAINGEIDYTESYRMDKQGNKKHMLIYAVPVIEKGEHIGIYGIYVDIGKRVEAEEELKTRNLELDNFVYKVSHDLRAPLASILGLINLTKIENGDVDREYYIDLMEGQVNKLDHFIRDILSHSKNLKMSLSSDRIDFRDIVQKCFDDLGYMNASTKVVREINIEIEEFISDKWRISEIFRNLIGNAIKYRNSEKDENLVAVRIIADNDGCLIEVKDNGIGIPTEKLPHVLEMFYRGVETSEGSGIGLYIVQKAVEKLKGRINIDSEPNKGTSFKIWLPSMDLHQ